MLSFAMLARAARYCPVALVLGCGWVAEARAESIPAPSSEHPVVTLAEGRLQGDRLGSAGALFRGIPYAQPPVDSLRWRAPEPPAAWNGTRAASEPAPPCLQAFVGWNWADAQRGSEDCLYLNVRTPNLDRRARLPVLVWIHGGANWAGSGGWVADTDLAERGNIVVVTVEYRLGIFGFLSHPDLTRESPHKASGNYALMDQIAALQWVRRNIETFGGDPSAITIGGDSAGGQDVGLLVLSPRAKGLFARAIQQSGTAGFGLPPRSLEENERLGMQLAELAGVPLPDSATPGTAAPPGVQIAILRAIPGRKLLDAQMLMRAPALSDNSFLFLQAVTDGWILPAPPVQLLAADRFAPVPLLIGNSAQELTLNGGDSASRRAVMEGFGDSAAAALDLYGLRDGLEPQADPILGSTSMQIADDLTFRCPANFTADMVTAAGQPVWRYQLERAAPDAPRIQHGAELGFVFRNLPLDPTVDRAQPVIQRYWINFIRSGNPNGPGLPNWPVYGEQKAYLALTRSGAVPARGLRSQICALLDRP